MTPTEKELLKDDVYNYLGARKVHACQAILPIIQRISCLNNVNKKFMSDAATIRKISLFRKRIIFKSIISKTVFK